MFFRNIRTLLHRPCRFSTGRFGRSNFLFSKRIATPARTLCSIAMCSAGFILPMSTYFVYCSPSSSTTATSQFLSDYEVDADYNHLAETMKRWGQACLLREPLEKYVVSVHGTVSSAKSSFINDFYGLEIQRSAMQEQDTIITIIEVIPEDDFSELVQMRTAKDEYAAQANVAASLTSRDLHARMGIPEGDKRHGVAFLVLDSEESVTRTKHFALFPDPKLLSRLRAAGRIRSLVINERIYDHPDEVFSIISTKDTNAKEWPDLMLRKRMAMDTIMIDTPGILSVNESVLEEMTSVIRQASFHLFLTSNPSSRDAKTALRAFAQASWNAYPTGLQSSFWNTTYFLITKIDQIITEEGCTDAHWFDFGRLFTCLYQGDNKLTIPLAPPVFSRCMFVGIPKKQNIEHKWAGGLPTVYQALGGLQGAGLALSKRKMLMIMKMAEEFDDHISKNSMGWATLGWLLPGHESAQQTSRRLYKKYERVFQHDSRKP